MRIGYELPGDPDDPVVQDYMNRAHGWASSFEGDLVGPFDHPSGIAVDAPFEVEHSLGELPGSIAVEDPGFTGKGVYATADDRDKWTSTSIVLRSPDANNKNITVRLRRRLDA